MPSHAPGCTSRSEFEHKDLTIISDRATGLLADDGASSSPRELALSRLEMGQDAQHAPAPPNPRLTEAA